ncbi:MAG: putative glycoside hydrolase [Patescibacteria group bacterium]
MKRFIVFLMIISAALGSFFILSREKTLKFGNDLANDVNGAVLNGENSSSSALAVFNPNSDIEPQKPLENPPEKIKAIYFTSWSASSQKRIDYLIKLAKETEINAVVIDIKDFSGIVAYDIKLDEVEKYKAKEIRISKINSLIKKLHEEGIYVIARITIFQDPILAKARPDLAIHSRTKCQSSDASGIKCHASSSTLWLDNKKLAWIDPAAKESWDYNIAIAKDAVSRGFDEINFDYIRFASDGNLNDMSFPFYDEKTLKRNIIKSFFGYLRSELEGVKISADLFGLATVESTDLGIGQVIEDAYSYFDYISPMVYPSHYAKGFLGYKNPANYPYEIIKYSMDGALKKLTIYNLQLTTNSTTTEILDSKFKIPNSRLRPWLQDFDLGADYNAQMVKKEIQAVYDAASSTPELIDGFMLWNPSNVYTQEALKLK